MVSSKEIWGFNSNELFEESRESSAYASG